GRQLSRNESSQPAEPGAVVSGAVAAIVASLRAGRPGSLLVGPGRAWSDRPPAGRRIAPDRPSGEDGIDQALLEVRRVQPGLDLDRELAGVADELADSPIRVVAGHDDELQRPEDRRFLARQAVDPGLRVVAELRSERGDQRLDEVGPGGEDEAQPVVAH